MSKGLIRSLGRAAPLAAPAVQRVTYPVRSLALTVTGGATTNLGLGSAVIGALPEGNVLLLGSVSYMQFTTASANAIATWAGFYSVGHSINAAQDLTLTDASMIGKATIAAAVAKASAVTRGTGLTAVILDNTDKTLNLNLNMLTADNSVTDSLTAPFVVNGYIQLAYIVLGDD